MSLLNFRLLAAVGLFASIPAADTPAVASVQAFRYDAQGRLVAACLARPGDAQRSEYALDAAGNRSKYLNTATVVVLPAPSRIYSADQRFFLVMQSDGNLVVYTSANVALWGAGTNGQPANEAVMQTDGNLVLYTPNGVPVWASNTAGNECAQLRLENDGNLVIRGLDGAVLWQSGSGGH